MSEGMLSRFSAHLCINVFRPGKKGNPWVLKTGASLVLRLPYLSLK